jgi:uncharacterized membrane protein YkvA (DUF1232 family)
MGVGKMIMNIGFVRSYVGQARLTWHLFRDPRVPLLTKSIPVITIIYLVSPIDWLINLIPVLGQLEDIAVLGLGMNLFIRLAPAEVVNEHREQIANSGLPLLG